MLLDTIFAPFVKERPICVMARAVLERLLDAQRLDALFARTAERQYTCELLFSSLVQLMGEVVLGVHPTVHAAYQAQQETLGVSTTALYNKFDRVETGVSAALVRDSAVRAEPVVKALRASHPRWVPGYQIKVLDGNHLARIGILNALLLPPRGQRRAAAAARRCVSRVATTALGQHFGLYSEHLFSILGDTLWHFPCFPPGRGGCYGASGGHLRTPGSQSYGALYGDCRAPGDLARLVRG